MSDLPPISTRFDSLGLDPTLLAGIHDAGFTHGTPIQSQTLPVALTGRDVAGQAQTGTGKTAAFLIALYNLLLTRPAPPGRTPTSVRALVVAPTRELAVQIHHDAEILGKHTGLKTAVVYGGTDYEKQRRQLADGIDVLIGTPGRLIDYFKQHVFDLRHAQVLGRGRPHVRPGIHRGHPLPDAPPAPAGPAAVDAVLRDALAAGAGAGLRAHEQPGAGADRAGQDDRRPGPADHVLPLHGGEGAAADRAAAAGRCPAHHDLREHQAHGRAARIGAQRQRVQRPGDLRRRAAAQTAAVPARLPAAVPAAASATASWRC